MKIRIDYVSNSSSSSCIVVLQKGYDFKKFIKDVARSCVSNPDSDCYTKDIVKRVKEQNIRNLDYCLNTHELLFLGEFCYGYKRITIRGKKNVSYCLECIGDKDKIVSQTENKLVMDSPLNSYGRTVPRDYMYGIRQYQNNGENDKKYFGEIVSDIILEITKGQEHETCSGLYEITMNTIFNTEAILSERKDSLVLGDWCKNLGKLKKLIKDGHRIFGIEMNQSGEGESSTSIYALSGWDSDFNKYANVEVLHTEIG